MDNNVVTLKEIKYLLDLKRKVIEAEEARVKASKALPEYADYSFSWYLYKATEDAFDKYPLFTQENRFTLHKQFSDWIYKPHTARCDVYLRKVGELPETKIYDQVSQAFDDADIFDIYALKEWLVFYDNDLSSEDKEIINILMDEQYEDLGNGCTATYEYAKNWQVGMEKRKLL